MRQPKKTTTLLTCYAVNPYKGSEDGTGWNILMSIAKNNKVIAITRENNQPAIDKYFAENKVEHADNIQFEYFDLPYYLRFWKKKSRGALLYFYLWQIGIIFFIKAKKFKFDIVHHLNFHSDWMPSFLWLLGKPFVWGPIGHHPKIPRDFILNTSGRKGLLIDRLKWYAKCTFWKFSPSLYMTKKKASKILCINSSVEKVLSLPKDKVVVLPAVATQSPPNLPRITDEFQVISIGRFVPLKGFDLTLESFARSYFQQDEVTQSKMRLILIGKGPMKTRLSVLAQELNIDHAVTFIDWIDRKDLDQYFANASAFLFPSHEGAGMVVPEALSFGVPTICLDNIGPGESINSSCGFAIKTESRREAIIKLGDALSLLIKDTELQTKLSAGATERFETMFTWDRKGKLISNLYQSMLNPLAFKKEPVEKIRS